MTTRGVAAAATVLVAWHVVGRPWRIAETALAAWALRIVGVASSRVGDQLLVARPSSPGFLVSVGAWCSALGPVLLFAALAVIASGPVRRRVGAAAVVGGVVVLVNLARIVTVVAIGAYDDSAALERWHDTVGVGATVVVLLGGTGVLLHRLWPMPSRRGRETAGRTVG